MKIPILGQGWKALLGAIALCAVATQSSKGAETMSTATNQKEVITIGGGCFWCIEAIREPLKGVESAVSGYSGGKNANPSYEDVCSGTTGHAEVVQVTFDPK